MADRQKIKKALEEALTKDKERKFTQTVELAVNLKDVDLSVPKNRVDVEVPLPKGRGKGARVGVFCTPDMAQKIRTAADLIVTPEQISEFAGNKRKARKMAGSVDYFMAEAPLMPQVGRFLGQVLGPRGKMPTPVPPGSDPTPQIQNLKRVIKVRSRENMTFHIRVGAENMSPDELSENIDAVLSRVAAALEHGEKNFRSVYVKTTMGPAVRLI